MNKYNIYMIIDEKIKPLWRELFLLGKQTNVPMITVFLNPKLKNTEVEQVLKEFSLEYEQPMEIIDRDLKVEHFEFGAYDTDNYQAFTDKIALVKFLMLEENQIKNDEKRIRRHQNKMEVKQKVYNLKDRKNSVKYKQYSINLKK